MHLRILQLAWPVFIGQMAVMLNGVIDTMMAGHLSSEDLAAVGLGASVYVTIYMALTGALLALIPIAAQHWGAGRMQDVTASTQQALWLALMMTVPGCLALAWTEPWIAFADPPAEVARIFSDYLRAVAVGLPAALLFRVFYALSNAIARPRVVMAINLVALALKVPLNAVFMYGWEPAALPLSVPAMGGAGAGVATAIVLWMSVVLAVLSLRRVPDLRALAIRFPVRLEAQRLAELLQVGLPIAGALLVEITSFTFMAIFLARLGAEVAGSHQIAANLAALVYMVPLALANATSALASQALGANDPAGARTIGHAGLRLAFGMALGVAALLWFGRSTIVEAYTSDPGVARAAAALAGLVACFHVFDALQTLCAFVLRAYRITTVPMIIYAVCLWGIGLSGGWMLAFGGLSLPAPLTELGQGASAFWLAGGASVMIACVLLGVAVRRVWADSVRSTSHHQEPATA